MQSNIKNSLEKLGKHYDTIADRLFKLGYKGYAGKPCDCVIANYLSAELNKSFRIIPGREEGFGVGHEDQFHWYSIVEHPTLKAMFQFLYNFDKGCYPGITLDEATYEEFWRKKYL